MRQIRNLIVLLILVALGGVPVAAQSSARTIPVNFKLYSSALSPDGKTLAIAANPAIYNNEVQPDLLPIILLDVATGKEKARLEGTQTDFTTGLTFTPDGRQLVSLHSNGQLNIWEVSSAKLTKSLVMPSFSMGLPKFLTDGKRLAFLAAGTPAYVMVVDISSGAITTTFGPHFATLAELQKSMTEFPGMGDVGYTDFDISPDGKTLATATFNNEVDLWDVASHKMTPLYTPTEKKMLLDIRPLVFTPDGKSLLYYNRTENKLHLWDAATQKERDLNVTGGAGFGLNAKGNMIAWIDKTQVYTWDFQATQPKKIGDIDANLKVTPYTKVYFAPDSKSVIVAGLATGSDTNQVYVLLTSA